MNLQRRDGISISAWIRSGIFALSAMTACSGTSQAVDLLEVKAETVSVAPGTVGAGLNVTVKNNGASAVNIGGFAFQLTVASTKITFTNITTATTPAYVFAGQSTFGPNIGISNTAQDWSASDIYAVASSGIALQPGQTLGLGYLVFDVAADASGSYKIVVEPFPATSLSNFTGDDIPIASIIDGQVNVVPEPSTILLSAIAGLAVCCAGKQRDRRRDSSV